MLSTVAIWITLLCGWMHLGTRGSGAKLLGLRPPQIFAEAERPLEVSCTLNDAVEHNLTSHDLAFRWKFRNKLIPISPNYVQTPNRTTAVLLLPQDQVGRDRDRHIITCYVGDNRDSIYVRIGFKPKPLVDLQITADNWEVLNIYWTKEENPSFTTSTSAYWKMGRDDLFKRCRNQNIEERRKYHCWVDLSNMELDPTTYFTIKVNSSNSIGHTTTQEEIFYLHEINRPGKINYIMLNKMETTWAMLGWESPAHGRSLVYQVKTTCLHSTQVFKVEGTDVHLSLNATGLIPGTQCEVAITARSVHGSLWSIPYTMDLVTKESVPLALPLTTRGSFDLTTSVDKTYITLYWQPVPVHLQGGQITKYKVVHWSEEDGGFHNEFEFPAENTNCQRLITIDRPDAESNLAVVAKTSVGYNTSIPLSAQIIVQPQSLNEIQKPANVTALINENNETEVRWVGHAEGDYTGYWCESAGKTCLSTIDWAKHISSPWKVPMSPLIDHRRYRFGVSLDLPAASSGISWSDCVYQKQGRSGPPTVENKTTLSSIKLKLKHASRCSIDAGFVYAYFITYCTTYGNSCDGPVRNLTVSRSEKTPVEIDGLEENTKYRVSVYSVTAAGASLTPHTDTITTTAGVKTEIKSKLAIYLSVGIVLLVLLCVGVYCACTKCRQTCRNTFRRLHIPIKLPDEEAQKETNSEEMPIGYAVPYHNLKPGSASPEEPTQNVIGSYTNVEGPPKLPPRMESIPRSDNDSGVSFTNELTTRPPSAPSPVKTRQLPEVVTIRKGGSAEDILDQNQKNIKKDEDYDYNYAPTVSLDETTGDTAKAASLSESASSSGDESDHYKEAAILINPRHSASNLSKGSHQEGPDLSGSSYGYKPVLLHDINQSSTPLMSKNALPPLAMDSKIGEPWEQVQPADSFGINEPVSLDPAVLLTMSDGDHIECYNIEDNVSDDNNSDYGYAPNPVPGLVIGTPDNAWLQHN